MICLTFQTLGIFNYLNVNFEVVRGTFTGSSQVADLRNSYDCAIIIDNDMTIRYGTKPQIRNC